MPIQHVDKEKSKGKTKLTVVETGREQAWTDDATFTYVGERHARVEGAEKVTGRARYSYDIQLTGQLYARVLRSPHPHARITRIDTSRAEALPGVRAILTHQNAPNIAWYEESKLFDRTVRFVGDEVAAVAADRQSLGNELRPGLPLCALFWMRETGALSAGTVALGLVDYVLWQLCGREPTTEPTIAAAQGTFNITAGDWHHSLLDHLGLGGVRWPRIGAFDQPVGEMRLGGHTLACFPGIGDQQSALAGAALQSGELSLNISTGSQASLLRNEIVPGNYGIRPYFGGQWLHTITNVPAGRALALLVDLLTELPRAQGLPLGEPWGYIAQAVAATPTTDLTADLSFFGGASGGALGNIHEGNLNAGHLFRAAFEYMARQYKACAQRLAPAADWERVVFSGGLAQAMPPLRAAIMQQLGGTYRLCDTNEDALAGLLALARLADTHTK